MGRGHAGAVASVTGGTAGLRQAIARCLAEEGGDIAIADIPSRREIEAMLTATGRAVLVHACDVTSPETVQHFAATSLGRYGHVDILIDDAGICPTDAFAETNYERFRRVLVVNFD
jgi:NAD(P)-dependent dehydrogenase (short-subunit alcohol dehydrogenase family)